MNVCPICLFVNPASASACSRCGRFQFDHRPPGVATMTAEDEAGAMPPLSDPCTATTADAVAEAGQVTRRSSRLAVSAALREPVPPPTMPVVVVSPSEALTNPRPGALSDVRSPTARTVIRFGLEVVRGEKLGKFLSILDGRNVIGRAVNEPVDIDLTGQEPIERVWVSRKHAVIYLDGRGLILEDLNSLNGTFVNRVRLAAGTQRALQVGDVVQFGTVQLRVTELPQS
jgi:hypothetical protein